MKKTKIISSTDSFDEAVAALRLGGIVAYPTETFYGLAVDPFNEDAVKDLFSLKGRAFKEPVSVIIGDVSMLDTMVEDLSPKAERLTEEFWPGPLTVVLPAKAEVPDLLTAKSSTGPTIGVRVPGCETARRLSIEFNGPITATSANPSGLKSAVQLS
ncbi:MAG: L-threonylcarbamoyladenylate synthase, partial [Thermodesulfobacteriota bacterium]